MENGSTGADALEVRDRQLDEEISAISDLLKTVIPDLSQWQRVVELQEQRTKLIMEKMRVQSDIEMQLLQSALASKANVGLEVTTTKGQIGNVIG